MPREFTALTREQYEALATSETAKLLQQRIRLWKDQPSWALTAAVLRRWHRGIYDKLRRYKRKDQVRTLRDWLQRASLTEIYGAYELLMDERRAPDQPPPALTPGGEEEMQRWLAREGLAAGGSAGTTDDSDGSTST